MAHSCMTRLPAAGLAPSAARHPAGGTILPSMCETPTTAVPSDSVIDMTERRQAEIALSHRRKSRDAGFDAHLVKPVAFDDLMDVLRAIERSR